MKKPASTPAAKSRPEPKSRLAWVRVDTGAHVLRADGIPLWDVYKSAKTSDTLRWYAQPYTVIGDSHKGGPFLEASQAKRWVEEHSIPWLYDLLGRFLKECR